MSQIWNLPIPAGLSFFNSKDVLNDGLDTLRTHNYSESNSTNLVDGMLWFNSGTNEFMARANGATYVLGKSNKADLNLLRKDGTIPATGNLNLSSKLITNLAAPVSNNDLSSKTYVDAFLHASTGHTHDGTSGEGTKIQYDNVSSFPGVLQKLVLNNDIDTKYFDGFTISKSSVVSTPTSGTLDLDNFTSDDGTSVIMLLYVSVTQVTVSSEVLDEVKIYGQAPDANTNLISEISIRYDNSHNDVHSSRVVIVPLDENNQVEFRCAMGSGPANDNINIDFYVIGHFAKVSP
jgi:hypothetical protein